MNYHVNTSQSMTIPSTEYAVDKDSVILMKDSYISYLLLLCLFLISFLIVIIWYEVQTVRSGSQSHISQQDTSNMSTADNYYKKQGTLVRHNNKLLTVEI